MSEGNTHYTEAAMQFYFPEITYTHSSQFRSAANRVAHERSRIATYTVDQLKELAGELGLDPDVYGSRKAPIIEDIEGRASHIRDVSSREAREQRESPEFKMAFVRGTLTKMRDEAKEGLDNWIPKFQKDPADALSWGTGVFETAGKYEIARRFVEWLDRDPEVTIAQIQEELQREIRRGSRYPSFSTSPTSNLMHTYRLQAYAEIQETISWVWKTGTEF